MEGHIKLYRKFMEWEWYMDINTKILFLHMLLKANWKEGKFQGNIVKRGSFISSISNLSAETGLSERNVRTAINHLKSTGEVTSKSTSKFTVFTIENYDLYQTTDKQDDKQATSDRQASDKQVTTIEERNKEIKKEDNNIPSKKSPKKKMGEYGHVTLSDEEIHKLTIEYGDLVPEAIKYLDEYVEMKGYKHKSSYLVIRKWVIDAIREKEKQAQQSKSKSNNQFHNFNQRDTDLNSLVMDRIKRRLADQQEGKDYGQDDIC